MKRKMPAPRNPHVAAAKFKKAGAHKKTFKALRRRQAVKHHGALAEWPGTGLLIRHRMGSNPSGSTNLQNFNKSVHLFC
jgi:hypothetical protein